MDAPITTFPSYVASGMVAPLSIMGKLRTHNPSFFSSLTVSEVEQIKALEPLGDGIGEH